MSRAVFFSLVIIMYLGVPLCGYGYYYYSEIQSEQVKTEAAFNNNPGISQPSPAEEDRMNGDLDTTSSEKLGFLGAAVVLSLIPSLMLVFKSRLMKE